MRKVGREIRKAPEGRFETGEHRVQRFRQIDQFDRNRRDVNARIEAPRGNALRPPSHGLQRRQAAANGKPAEDAGQHRGQRDEGPQGLAKRVHELFVVRDVGGDADNGGLRTLDSARHLDGQPTERPVLGVAPDHRLRQRPRDRLRQQGVREISATGGEQRIATGGDDDDREAGVPDQRIVEQLGNRRQILRGPYPLQRVACQFELAGQDIQVLLDEVRLDRSADQVAEHQHDDRRDERE